MTYSLVKNIEWKSTNTYEFLIITKNEKLRYEFNKLSRTRKLNGAPMVIHFGKTIMDDANYHLVYLDPSFNANLQDVFNTINGKETLLISNNYSDQRFIMLNLLNGEDGKLKFEINRANILNQGLLIDPEIVLDGGIEVDPKLYLASQDSLYFMLSEIQRMRTVFDSLKKNIAESKGVIEQQQLEIDTKQRIVNNQINLIRKGERSIGELTAQSDYQQQTIWRLIFFSLAVVAILILLLRAYFVRKRFTKELQEQKDELTQLLNELHSTQFQLVQSEKMASLGVLTSGIAHEINNASNFVYSGIQILSSNYSDVRAILMDIQEIKSKKGKTGDLKVNDNIDLKETISSIDQMIEFIFTGSERTTEIVQGLRTFSRSEDVNQTEIDVHEEIDAGLVLLNSRIRNQMNIQKDLEATRFIVGGFKGQLSQVFLNMISNAIDAINEQKIPGEIKILTKNESDNIVVLISDNGKGVDQSALPKIYDPFFTTKETGKGTGLGLSIAYGIIERHNGVISVNSVLNEGTTFKIELPLLIKP